MGDPLPIAVPMDTKKETWLFPIFAYLGHDIYASTKIWIAKHCPFSPINNFGIAKLII